MRRGGHKFETMDKTIGGFGGGRYYIRRLQYCATAEGTTSVPLFGIATPHVSQGGASIYSFV